MQTDEVVRVALVNDYEVVVVGLAGILAPYADRVAVIELDASRPVRSEVDVILYDAFGQVQGGRLDVASVLGGASTRLIVYSWNTEPGLIEQNLTAGAHGYVSKTVDADSLVTAIERVHRGESVVSVPEWKPGEDQTLPSATSMDKQGGNWPGRPEGLTPREAEVLALICQGLSNLQISDQAYLAPNTIKTHVRTTYRKIGVSRRSQAVLWGIEHGFLPDSVQRRLQE